MSLITLQTDFGTRDAFVGIMKGVILGIDPELRVVDLSHHIPPFDLRLPGLNWVAAVPYFPSGTVHVAVVDPGVGTDRDIIVAVIHDQLFLCPDNGLLTPVIEEFGAPKECYTVENLSWRAKPPHPTFHGRDILAPVAAHLALGEPLTLVGHRRTSWVTLPWSKPAVAPGRIDGEVLYIDHFGNLWLNVRPRDLVAAGIEPAQAKASVESWTTTGVRPSYGFAGEGDLVLLTNSVGHLELGINKGNAAEKLGVGQGSKVTIERG